MPRTKKNKPKVAKKEERVITPLVADRMWEIIMDMSATRVQQLSNDKIHTERLYLLADKAKNEFLESLLPALGAEGEVFADDILTVLTTMTLITANEMFEKNDEIMEFLNLPEVVESTVSKPHSIKDGAPLYM